MWPKYKRATKSSAKCGVEVTRSRRRERMGHRPRRPRHAHLVLRCSLAPGPQPTSPKASEGHLLRCLHDPGRKVAEGSLVLRAELEVQKKQMKFNRDATISDFAELQHRCP